MAISQTHHGKEESMTVADPIRPYHHGHLRRALLDAALQVLTEEGLAGLTLRAVARRAGVSEAAPYHHFASKAALVEALVVETLQQLAQALQEILSRWRSPPGRPFMD
jgi:AcrR family transcriptional regulator